MGCWAVAQSRLLERSNPRLDTWTNLPEGMLYGTVWAIWSGTMEDFEEDELDISALLAARPTLTE